MRLVCLFLCFSLNLMADIPPNISGRDIQAVSPGANFALTLERLTEKQKGSFWLGWEVPAVSSKMNYCCPDEDACGLDDGSMYYRNNDAQKQMGPTGTMMLFLKVRDGEVLKTRMYTDHCPIYTGDQQVTWISGVNPTDSVNVLAGLVNTRHEQHREVEDLVGLVAVHDVADVGDHLESWATNPGDEDLRRSSVFWLAHTREAQGFRVLNQLADQETDRDMLETVVFGYHIIKDPRADERLLDMARNHDDGEIRERATFWLAEKGGPEVEALIEEQLNSYDKEVAEKAVFALTRLPNADVSKRLVDLSKNAKNPDVRGAALFWLGQKGDDVAFARLTEALNDPNTEVAEKAIFGLAQFKDGRGVTVLRDLAVTGKRDAVREKAVFWLSQNNGIDNMDIIEQVLNEDRSRKVREQALFALSQVQGDVALNRLLELAEGHEDKEIRGKALFWLSQKASDRIMATLTDAVNDPDEDIKVQAVFSIAQMNDADALPLLRKLAREHQSPEVRKQALFWLGQKGDSAALEMVKEVLFEEQ